MHWAQIRTLRRLYIRMRGEAVPPRCFPDNPSYPTKQED
jgi:hypothetical protein